MTTITDWPQAPDVEPSPWYQIQNKADDSTTADVEIYDDIFPMFGVDAQSFRSDLNALGDGITTINLHINSRGGSVYDAIAIMNTLRQHDARVVTTVDGVAASSAGFIAVGASDELIIAENAELMAHLPSGVVIGGAADMRKMAQDLDRIANNIASIFADRAGGTVDEWMQVLTDETWWSAQEAVDAGIADKMLKAPKRKPAKGTKNHFDLTVFNHAGRSNAPAPRVPQAHNETPLPVEAEETNGKEGIMPTLSESVLEKLGLDADADDAAVVAAIEALKTEKPAEDNPPQDPPAEPSVEQVTEVAAKFGLTVMDKTVADQLQADARAGAEARAQQGSEANDRLITDALNAGKISPASEDTWRKSLVENRDQTVALLATLPENRLPVTEIGHGVSREERPVDADKAQMFAMITGTSLNGKDA